MKDLSNYSLKAHNTFGIDVRCRRFVEFASVGELQCLLRSEHFAVPPLVIGGGSNMLFTKDYDGLVLHSAIKTFHAQPTDSGDVLVSVGSGEDWDTTVERCTRHGWHGLENLSLIPGTVGAAAVQNIGAYGVEAKDCIERVEVVEIATGEQHTLSCCHCHYGYRHSRFKVSPDNGGWQGRYIITGVTFRLSRSFTPKLDYGNIRSQLAQSNITAPTAMQLRQAIIDIRRAKLPDPEEIGSAGSFFVNPVVSQETYEALRSHYPDMPHYVVPNGVKLAAGWLIDQCGWRGKTMGRAGVHSQQALVLVNSGGATGSDVLRLCQAIQHDVRSRFGVALQPEVIII